MPELQIQHVDGRVETRVLSRTQSLTIGRQAFNDISIPEDAVAPLHCRILWNKTTFEVTAATSEGVEVNGTSVAHAHLRSGDVIRIGSLDLIYEDESEIPEFRSVPDPQPGASGSAVQRGETARSASRRSGPPEPPPRPADESSLFEGEILTESQTLAATEDEPEPAAPRSPVRPRSPTMTLSPGSRARPGEQDALRSPLVLGLSLGGLVLLLVTGIFWFLIGREQATRLYDRAVAELNEGQYTQSIASFEQFLQQYPDHTYRLQAERGLGRAQIQKEISGANPDWKRGLENLQELISAQRNEPQFSDLQPILVRHSEDIALGAARTAESTRDSGLLTVSEDAQVVLERFSDPSVPPTAALNRIKEARASAVIAIGKQKVFDDSMAAVDSALAQGQPMVALTEREKLVRTYEGFAAHPRVKAALTKALDLERSVIAPDESEQAAETTEAAWPVSPALGLFLTRTRTDETSVGRSALAHGKDCLYAVDTVTGETVWRRVIGFDRPFFPVAVQAGRSAWLVYDGTRQSLVLCAAESGALIWRLKLDSPPRSAPLIHESQIYLALGDRTLTRIDLETGRLTERLRFSQNVHGPPVLAPDGRHLLIPGEMSMIYALSMRPLRPAATTFTDHATGALVAPPLAMGKLLLLCENDRSDSARLRLWDIADPQKPLVELAGPEIRIQGTVRESPILRGNQLLVPSTGERMAAFVVSDDPGRAGLKSIATYRLHDEDQKSPAADDSGVPGLPRSTRIPMYVALGADRQFWVASSAFRRLEIEADAIHLNSSAVAVGIASQPLQSVGDQFVIGRRLPFHDGVIVTAVDRERMVSPWRTIVGSRLLQAIPGRGGGMIGVSESGQVIVLSADRLKQGGIDRNAAELELPAGLVSPLVSSLLHDGRIFVAANGDTPTLWIVGSGGQLELTTRLAPGDRVQAGAALLDDGLIVALNGRLKLVGTSSGRRAVQDWIAPVGDPAPPPWKHLLRLEGDEVLACRSDGVLVRLQIRTAEVPHLAEAARLPLGAPLDLPPRLQGEQLVVADSAGTVHLLNWRTFDTEGKRSFAEGIRGLWSGSGGVFVWSGDGRLQFVTAGRDLPPRWTIGLQGLEPAGVPLEKDGTVWVACRDGTVIALNGQTGNEVHRVQVPQALTHGPQAWDGDLFAVASDGAVYQLTAARKAE